MCKVFKSGSVSDLNPKNTEPSKISALMISRENQLTSSLNTSSESVQHTDVVHEVQDLLPKSRELVSSLTTPKNELVNDSKETMSILLNSTSEDITSLPPKLSSSVDLSSTSIKLDISDDIPSSPPVKLSSSLDLISSSEPKEQNLKISLEEPEPNISKYDFNSKLNGITTKGNAIYDKLSPSLQKLVSDSIPSSNEGKKDIEKLLHFSAFKLGNTTETQRLEIRTVLLTAVGLGLSKDELGALKEKLRNSTPEQTSKMLEVLNDPQKLITKFKGEPTKIDPNSMPLLNINVQDKPKKLEVTESTLKNLKGAQMVNFAVKSIIIDGAPNQAPDMIRSKGANIILFNNESSVSTELLKDGLVNSNIEKAKEIDKLRKQNGIEIAMGEEFSNIFSKAPSTAVLGTGKCGEHAVMSFALLTDPLSRKQMGVDLQPGTQIFLTLGDRIDHSYVLVAEPGAVNPTNKINGDSKRINIIDPKKVVVVDPWMPIPVSHTLDRCNSDIQTVGQNQKDAVWKLTVVIQEDGSSAILDKNKDGKNVLTQIPSFGDTSMLDQLKGLQEKYHSNVKQRAIVKGVLPLEEDARLAIGSGIAVSSRAGKGLALDKNAGLYANSHISTSTPSDLYQAVDNDKNPIGDPLNFFEGKKSYLESQYSSIEQLAQDTSVIKIVKDNLNKLPENVRPGLEYAISTYKED